MPVSFLLFFYDAKILATLFFLALIFFFLESGNISPYLVNFQRKNHKNIYRIVSNNSIDPITERETVKLSLPLGDTNSTPVVMSDTPNATPKVLIPAD
jgi:hypothetical protein